MPRSCDFDNDSDRLRRIFGAVNRDPVSLRVADKLLEIFIEVLDHICPDGVCLLAPLAPVGQGGERGNTSGHAALGVGIQGALQGWVGKRSADALTKFRLGSLKWHRSIFLIRKA